MIPKTNVYQKTKTELNPGQETAYSAERLLSTHKAPTLHLQNWIWWLMPVILALRVQGHPVTQQVPDQLGLHETLVCEQIKESRQIHL